MGRRRLPRPAINPLYAALRKQGNISHILARHVEGASHMTEGYNRAVAGNVGVCIDTSGPAGTDMVTGPYSAQADSIPILCITGQVPRAFQQAFHLMRSGRPGPVLIDLPFDVQMAEIEFDPDTYSSLPVYKPAATRAQVEKVLSMLNTAERPLIVSVGIHPTLTQVPPNGPRSMTAVRRPSLLQRAAIGGPA